MCPTKRSLAKAGIKSVPMRTRGNKFPLIEVTDSESNAKRIMMRHSKRGVNTYILKKGNQYIIKPRSRADLNKALTYE